MQKKVIHILGASGSGTTTLGKAIADAFHYKHFDSDDYFWLPTPIPFTEKRNIDERQRLLFSDIEEAENCVITGSMCGWGDMFIPMLTLVLLIEIPIDIRITRLQKREAERFGDRIKAGGDMYQNHQEFIEWAEKYDTAGIEIRSKVLHEQWLKNVGSPIIRLDGQRTTDEQVSDIKNYL